jgi:hypothetical protein
LAITVTATGRPFVASSAQNLPGTQHHDGLVGRAVLQEQAQRQVPIGGRRRRAGSPGAAGDDQTCLSGIVSGLVVRSGFTICQQPRSEPGEGRHVSELW